MRDAQDINWRTVFNQAYDRSLQFKPGDALKRTNIEIALQAEDEAQSKATAEKIIHQAVEAEILQQKSDGYRIVREGPSTGDIRQRLNNKLREIMRNGEDKIIRSPTSSGKTYRASTTRWQKYPEITGDQPVILLSGTTNARNDAVTKSKGSKATHEVLKGREDACPLARGNYDSDNTEGNPRISAPDGSEPSEWFKTMCEQRGLHLSVAHGMFERAHDGDLPCCQNNTCTTKKQWKNIPRDNNNKVNYDILHATHPFARVPQLVKDCNLIIDERPNFRLNMTTGRVRQMVTKYLEEIEAPVSTWESLIIGLTGDLNLDGHQLQEALEMPDTNWFLQEKKAHALAPGIVKALVGAEERKHDRWVGAARYTYPTLNPHHEGPEQIVTIRIVIDGDSKNVRLLQSIPDFTEARSVIGLDAYPTMPKWNGNTLQSMDLEEIVTEEELHKWRRNERNLKIIQIGDNKNSWTTGKFNNSKVRILSNELRRQYGDGFQTGTTSKRFEDDLRDILINSGIKNPDTIHFGNEKSVEDFDSEQVGLVAGCISPSSDQIKDWLALLDKEATPRRDIDDEYKGQEWVGPDNTVAMDLLADVREYGVLQTCGRYARSPQQPDDGAVVYVLTNVLPERYVDEKKRDVNPFGKKAKQILDHLTSQNGATVKEIKQAVGDTISKKHIHETLNNCRDHPWMDVDRGAGQCNSDVFHADYRPGGLVEV